MKILTQQLLLFCYNLLLTGVKFQLSELNVLCPFNALCQNKNITFYSPELFSIAIKYSNSGHYINFEILSATYVENVTLTY